MQTLAGLAIGTLVLASLAVAIRLLALHRRSGETPELLLGLMLLLCVGLGYPLQIAAARVEPARMQVLMGISSLAVGAGFSCLIAFTWRVFRRESQRARAGALAGIAVLMATGGWDAFDRVVLASGRGAADPTAASLTHAATVIGAYVWTAYESLRYHAIMKRRERLGMADPVVCNRLLLWGLMGVIVSIGVSINVAAGIAGVSILENAPVLLASSASGLAQTVLLVLAFAPPRAYLAWVRGAAAQHA
jgi:hypothetical protein